MSIPTFNPRTIVLMIIIFVVALLRLVANLVPGMGALNMFTPIGAMALFGGAYFTGKIKPFALPLLTLFISDLILSFTIYKSYRSGLLYTGWVWTYLAYALMVVAGKLLIRNVNVTNIVFAIVTATLIHWLVSDIGGCLNQPGNQSTFAIYLQRLIAAIPFELKFLEGTAIYSAIMFGVFAFAEKRFRKLRTAEL